MTTIGRGDELEVDLLRLGARVTAARVRLPGGDTRDIVVGYSSEEEYATDDDFRGATVGRYANRIAGAGFDLDGVLHTLAANDRGSTLHGGPEGFSTRSWDLVDHGPRHAELELVSPDGDQGFPGRVTVRARFEVDGPALRTSYVATTDAATHVSLASHPYLDLDGTGSTCDLRLTVGADRYTVVDDAGLPTGELRAVAGTAFELRGARLGDVVGSSDPEVWAAAGLDHNFVLRGSGLRTVAVLEGRDLRAELATDQPGLQVYTGGGRIPGIALEPQHFPDSPHHPEWPSTVLRPGETYRWTSVLRVLPLPPAVADVGAPP